MRLPTIDVLITSAASTARRFPLVIASALLAAWAAFTLVEGSFESHPSAERILAVASLGLPLLFGMAVAAERREQSARFAFHGLGVIILIGIWYYWPKWPVAQALRYTQLSAAFHLFAAFAPYTSRGEAAGFWQYNKALFLRFLTSTLYTGVLYAGLAIAMLALDKLLGVTIHGDDYAKLWILLAFVFNTWFFLGGVPRDFAQLDLLTDYPTGLRVFTQYVLIPLVAVYVVILTIYLGKVTLTQKWPSGWIGYLVSCVAAIGILAWLLVHPLEERVEYAWVKAYTRGFYIALMPAIFMLWLAIYKRVEQHGLTEHRYLLVVLSVWLAFVAAYYTFTRSRSIKLIPASLCAVAIFTFIGPWNAYAVSRRNQMGRLTEVLTRGQMLRDGKLQRAATRPSLDDRQEISSALNYLIHAHGVESLKSMLPDTLNVALAKPINQRRSTYAEPDVQAIMTWMGVDYVTPRGQSYGEYFGYYAQPVARAIDIRDFDLAVDINGWPMRDSLVIADSLYMKLGKDSASITLIHGHSTILTIPLKDATDSVPVYQARQNTGGHPGALRVSADSGGVRALLVITQVGGQKQASGVRVSSLMGQLYLRLR